MSKRNKRHRRDRYSFNGDANWRGRHRRRFNEAQSTAPELSAWCADRGVHMTVTNHGEHFRFYMNYLCVAQWWPSSAKLIVYGRWKEGIHAHDWQQVMYVLDAIADHEIGPAT